MKKNPFLLVLTFVLVSTSVFGQDYSGSYDDDLFLGTPTYEYNVSFDFEFDNPSCTITNFSYSNLSIVALSSGVTVDSIPYASYLSSTNTFYVLFEVTIGGNTKLKDLYLELSAIADNAGLGPGICY